MKKLRRSVNILFFLFCITIIFIFFFSKNVNAVMINKSGITIEDEKNINENYKKIKVEKVTLRKPKIKNQTYIYNGKQQVAKLKSFDEKTMEVSNNQGTEAGTRYVIVKLKDKENYQWSDGTIEDIKLKWIINPISIEDAELLNITNKTYTGKKKKQDVTVKIGQTVLEKGKDYKVLYKNNINTGKAKITIKGICNYTGTLTKTFIIKPSQVKNVIITKKNESEMTLKWDENLGNVTGYKKYIYNQKEKKYQCIGKLQKTMCTITNMQKGSKYRFKIRAYKTIKGVQYFGKYSSTINIDEF